MAKLTAKLTPREEDVCKAVDDFWEEHQVGPTFNDLGEMLGIKPRPTVTQMVARIQDKGFLVRDPYIRRSIRPTAQWLMWKNRIYDRATNVNVTEAMETDPRRFEHFTEDEIDYLYSIHHVGGPLTLAGVYEQADLLDEIRRVQALLAPLLFEADVRQEIEDYVAKRQGIEAVQGHGSPTPKTSA